MGLLATGSLDSWGLQEGQGASVHNHFKLESFKSPNISQRKRLRLRHMPTNTPYWTLFSAPGAASLWSFKRGRLKRKPTLKTYDGSWQGASRTTQVYSVWEPGQVPKRRVPGLQDGGVKQKSESRNKEFSAPSAHSLIKCPLLQEVLMTSQAERPPIFWGFPTADWALVSHPENQSS